MEEKVCGNCHNFWREGDKYCRYCGAPMNHPEYIVRDIACIYGPPPVLRGHSCQKCGYGWQTEQMIDRERFCPKCGAPAPAKEMDGKDDLWGTRTPVQRKKGFLGHLFNKDAEKQ